MTIILYKHKALIIGNEYARKHRELETADRNIIQGQKGFYFFYFIKLNNCVERK